ncbi:hypothetical protein ACMBCN_01385 [Candidatus Liberibacter asiaticus]
MPIPRQRHQKLDVINLILASVRITRRKVTSNFQGRSLKELQWF